MTLKEYQKKRDFRKSPEPKGKPKKSGKGRLYVIQKHDASRLHYDFRLEHDGVLLSWAVPKGPALDPGEKRLAVHVEDHPVEYGDFEGTIPEGEYGAGTVMLWDQGTWKPEGDVGEAIERGKLKFTLKGKKLKGGWTLVRMRSRQSDDRDNWLLIKEDDKQARALDDGDILEEEPDSVASGRSLDEIAEADGDVWESDREKKKSKSSSSKTETRSKKKKKGDRKNNSNDDNAASPPDAGGLPRARKASFPRSVSPQLATLVDKAPSGERWLHEVKFDGYRLLAMFHNGKAKLVTRNGKDWTRKFPSIAGAVEELPVDRVVLDGEVVVQNRDGTQDFQALQNVMKGARDADLSYYVFDVLHCSGIDLTRTPLEARKAFLRKLVETLPEGTPVRYSDHVKGSSDKAYKEACKLGMEGIISKRADSGYEPKRSRSWLKIKCLQRQEFVVGGYSEPGGSRKGFGALLLGYHQNGDFVYAGRVGTGFDEATLKQLSERLEKLERETPPFANPPTGREAKGVHWVTPKLVAEVAFAQWTSDGVLRHPAFEGLREDKKPEQVVRERPAARNESSGSKTMKQGGRSGSGSARKGGGGSEKVEVAGVRLSNPDKVLYSDQGLTKQGLAEFYASIADWVLPHVTGRPLTIVRCPEGQESECFYQKHMTESLPDTIGRVNIKEKRGKGAYIVIDDLAGLISLVQLGTLEMHPWGSRADDPDKPDLLVFDLDPAPDVAWSAVIEGTRMLHERLDDLGLENFLKTSGGKGLHVVVPLTRRHSWDEAKAFTKAIADTIVKEDPERYIATMSKSKRKGKIFIDYLRNARGATSVAAYSTRARPGATVSTPLRWEDLSDSLDPAKYSVENLPRRLASLKKDPWEYFFTTRQSITAKIKKSLGL